MNTDNISVGEKLGGFPIQDATASMFKKFMWRNNSGSETALYNERNTPPFVFQEQITRHPIPDSPPGDFVLLSSSDIATNFGITVSELDTFQTTLHGAPMFQVSQSTSFPHIYKFSYCRLQPFIGNLDESFSGTTVVSQKNLLSLSIPFNFRDKAWAGTIYRTTETGELSLDGNDTVLPTQLPFIFDNGWFNLYANDTNTLSVNTINRDRAPAITCYVYTGGFGNIGNIQSLTAGAGIAITGTTENPVISNTGVVSLTAGTGISITGTSNNPIISGTSLSQWTTTSNGIFYNDSNKTVIVGKSNTDPINGYSMDISGTLYTDNLIAQSYETFSDMRLKCNISTFNTTNSVLSLGTFAYNYINNSTVTEIGLLAQEVEKIAPEIVREQCGYKTIQYDRLPILLLPVIKQQQQQITYLEEQIRMLKAAVGIR